MSYEQTYPSGDHRGPDLGRVSALGVIADHWGLVLAYGLVSLGLGVTLAVWPDETLKVAAILIGIQLLASGLIRVIYSIAATGVETALRVLLGVTGALAFVVGLLCLRDPVQTLLAITLILGVWWVVSGVIDIIGAVLSPVPGRPGWDIFAGLVSVLAGGFLLVDPHLSLGVLVFVTCAWLIVTGLLAVVTAFRLRSLRTPETGTASTSTPPAPAL
ncbi:hypothetical protein GCM10009798_43080 [Nocardioides panacihumi]|uniref:HdeD family acid-resistance protein n=1 Tax=Nocardioides panacihumi TaxID=400774 RepID=A0ABN2RYJ3_9ACTN